MLRIQDFFVRNHEFCFEFKIFSFKVMHWEPVTGGRPGSIRSSGPPSARKPRGPVGPIYPLRARRRPRRVRRLSVPLCTLPLLTSLSELLSGLSLSELLSLNLSLNSSEGHLFLKFHSWRSPFSEFSSTLVPLDVTVASLPGE